MNLPPPSVTPSPVFLPEELVAEVLSFLPVKSLLRLSCVSKSWKSFVSDPTFVKRHLNRSTRNADLTLVSPSLGEIYFTTFHLLENPPTIITLSKDPNHQLNDKGGFYIVGSCNGLLCLLFDSCIPGDIITYLRFWNPATRKISGKLGYSSHNNQCFNRNLTFGYDDTTDTYKVVYFTPHRREVRVFSLGNNVWRNIQNSPLDHSDYPLNVVNVSGSFNWLAIHNYTSEGPIISLDLSTETHSHILSPQVFDKGLIIEPNLSVLNDCLCFSHDFKQTHFVIWQMKEFRVEDSWTQFLKISYHDLQIYDHFRLLQLCFLEKSGTLLLTRKFQSQSIIYNWRNNRVERVQISWPYGAKDYVESLVWYC